MDTPWHSQCNGKLSKGCNLCVKGRKVVLFITGLCPQRCFYCPVNEKKFGHDVVYANEWKIKDPNNPVELIEEAKLTSARGAGITGGDPLANVDRCVHYIKLLKKTFGKQFHTHLYTPLALVSEDKLLLLYQAGLDEIRFHPDMDDNTLWPRLKLARRFNWDVGVEIPVVPGYEDKTKILIDYISDKVDFLNLNELELSDTNVEHYKLNFAPKAKYSYGVAGCDAIAKELLKYAKIPTHYCTSKLKDSVQVAKRIKLRAKNVALPTDEITDEGTLLRGCIYIPELKPGGKGIITPDYTEKIKSVKASLPFKTHYDEKKARLLVSIDILEKNNERIKKLNLIPAIVEEYPTQDAIEVEVEFI